VTGNISVSQNHSGQSAGGDAAHALNARFDSDWQAISSGLRRDLGAQIYGQWIRSISLGDFCDLTGTLELLLPSDFSASWVSDHYADRLRLAWASTNNSVKQLKIRTRPGAARVEMLRPSGVTERPAAQHIAEALPVRSALDPRMTFANFVKGQTNVLALSAAERVASKDKPLFNPPHLQTATGQGKLRARPYSEKDFFVPEAQAELSFVLGEDGKATQLIFRQPGGQMVAKKLP